MYEHIALAQLYEDQHPFLVSFGGNWQLKYN